MERVLLPVVRWAKRNNGVILIVLALVGMFYLILCSFEL